MAALTPLSKLSAAYRKCAHAAIAVSKNSYCPYSGFSVGAALLHPDGTVTDGCNWENCTFQASCAERCAILKANSMGKRAVVAVAVYGKVLASSVDTANEALVTPCGLCRQMLAEVEDLSNTDMDLILVAHNQESAHIASLAELLPAAFGPSDFGVDLTKWAPTGKLKNRRTSAAARKSKQAGTTTPPSSPSARKKAAATAAAAATPKSQGRAKSGSRSAAAASPSKASPKKKTPAGKKA